MNKCANLSYVHFLFYFRPTNFTLLFPSFPPLPPLSLLLLSLQLTWQHSTVCITALRDSETSQTAYTTWPTTPVQLTNIHTDSYSTTHMHIIQCIAHYTTPLFIPFVILLNPPPPPKKNYEQLICDTNTIHYL